MAALNLYLVIQNTENLFGDILNKAVICAESENKAIAVLLDRCGSDRYSDVGVVIQSRRLRVSKIGVADEDMDEEMLCVDIVEDWTGKVSKTEVVLKKTTVEVAEVDSDEVFEYINENSN